MSSLRLALKQSLQESGPLVPRPAKGRKRDGTMSDKKRKRKPGDPPRKRGRPPKHRPHLSNPQPLQKDSPSSSKAESDEEQSNEYQHYSSEHEFSGEEAESESQDESKPTEVEATTPKVAAVPSDESDEDSKGKKLLKKQEKQSLKHSAAKKIQDQWMKKKITVSAEEDNQQPEQQEPPAKVTPDVNESQAKAPELPVDQQVARKKKKGKRKDKDVTNTSGKCKTVPAPLLDVLEWSRGIPNKKARKSVSVGLRVKVRFATKVKREGKVIRKKKWYGGRVMGVSKEGSKIKIQYDDGTAEVTKFPDKDIVVDDAFNGEHESDAARFTPRNIEKPGDSETEDDPDLNGGIDNAKVGKEESTTALIETEEEDQHVKPPQKLEPKNADVPVSDAASVVKQYESSEELPSKPSTDSEESQKISEPMPVKEDAEQVSAPPLVTETRPLAEKVEEVTEKEPIDEPMQEVDVLPEEEKLTKVTLNDSSVESKEASNTVTDSVSISQTRSDGEVDQRGEGEESGHDLVECEKNASDEPQTSTTRVTQTKPTLTIRIPNLKRDEANGTSSRWSPGSDLNPQVDESTEDGSEQPDYPMNPTTESSISEEKNCTEEFQPPKPVSKKRKCDQDEQEVPTKRIQIQRIMEESLDESQNISCERQDISKLETIPEIIENEPVAGPESNEEVEEAVVEKEVQNVETKADASALPQNVAPVSMEDEQTQGSESSSIRRQKRRRTEKGGSKATQNFEAEQPPPDVSSQGGKDETLNVKEDLNDNNKETSLLDNNPSSAIDEEEKPPAISGSEEASLGMVTPYDDSTSAVSGQATPRDKSAAAAQPVVRSGRRAAQQANERITSKQEMAAEPAVGKKRKKRERLEVKRRNSEDDSDGTTIDDDNPNWVQCERCSKWRVLPNNVKVSSLPNHWYCENNIYDSKRNSCEAPEQSFAQVSKEKKRGRKRMRYRAEAAQPIPEPSTSEPVDKEPSAPIESVKQRQLQRARSPIAGKEAATAKDLERTCSDSTKKEKRVSPHPMVPPEKQSSLEKSEEINTSEKKGLSNSGKKRTSDVTETTTTADSTEGKVKRGRGRGRRSGEIGKDAEKSSSSVGVSEKTQKENDSADNLEWVQCEKCEKWRKLPPHISADELPEVWYCSLNTWNPDSAKCDVPEDKAEGLQDVAAFGGPATHSSNKLSYRNLIFGSSGKKLHRQISERIRASESIFANPTETTDHPTCMYAQSSAFVPRPRSNFVEETGSMSVFDLMTHSNLWAELRVAKHQINNCTPDTSISKSFQPKPKLSYEQLSKSSKQLFKEVIYDVLKAGTLSGGKVYQTVKSKKLKANSDWEMLRCDCNEDVVVSALCDMVSCGSIQVVQKISADWSLKDWSPCYRRAQTSQDGSVGSGDSQLRPSRCMKIAKPWKLAQDSKDSVEWIR